MTEETASPSTAVRLAVGAVRAYQGARMGRQSPCRFTPTCSEYAAVAMSRHGFFVGMRLTLGRLGRCQPWGAFGFDPVPEQEA
jgi:putative membrane protein insertion efficiency factor